MRYASQHLLSDTCNYIQHQCYFHIRIPPFQKLPISHLSKDNCLWKWVQTRIITVIIGLRVKIKLQPFLAYDTSWWIVYRINTMTPLTLKDNKSPWYPWTEGWVDTVLIGENLPYQEMNSVSAVSQNAAQSLYWHKYLATKMNKVGNVHITLWHIQTFALLKTCVKPFCLK